jgi:hypothetical protein
LVLESAVAAGGGQGRTAIGAEAAVIAVVCLAARAVHDCFLVLWANSGRRDATPASCRVSRTTSRSIARYRVDW